MTAITLGHAGRRGKTAMTGAIKVGQIGRGGGRLVGAAQLRGPRLRFGSSGPQAFAGGFVDFLLGRSSSRGLR
jgi:hypothetical protein